MDVQEEDVNEQQRKGYQKNCEPDLKTRGNCCQKYEKGLFKSFYCEINTNL